MFNADLSQQCSVLRCTHSLGVCVDAVVLLIIGGIYNNNIHYLCKYNDSRMKAYFFTSYWPTERTFFVSPFHLLLLLLLLFLFLLLLLCSCLYHIVPIGFAILTNTIVLKHNLSGLWWDNGG